MPNGVVIAYPIHGLMVIELHIWPSRNVTFPGKVYKLSQPPLCRGSRGVLIVCLLELRLQSHFLVIQLGVIGVSIVRVSIVTPRFFHIILAPESLCVHGGGTPGKCPGVSRIVRVHHVGSRMGGMVRLLMLSMLWLLLCSLLPL